MSHNPISVIIPCHRVVGAGGSLTGYAGGIDIKIKLLRHEGIDMRGLFIPEEGNSPVDHAGLNLIDKSNVIYYTLV